MNAIKSEPNLKMQLICCGAMLLERFGKAIDLVASDGFQIDSQIHMEVEGGQPQTMSKSVGLGIIEFTSEFERLAPDIVLVIGDRYEALSAVVAAAMVNIPIAHIQGGEVSGSIDESIRHVITKFSQLHFPATERAAHFIRKMGELPEDVHNVGCPSGDEITRIDYSRSLNGSDLPGVGAEIDLSKPFFLVIFHPNTTDVNSQATQTRTLIKAIEQAECQTIWVWPNIDAGADDISKELRRYRETKSNDWLRLVKNLESTLFIRLLVKANCLIGNSSSFVRDSSFTGTPVVLVGDRQSRREHGQNVITCDMNMEQISSAIKFQMNHGSYLTENLYGDGNASERIVGLIKSFKPYNQKRLAYLDENLPNN